MKRFLYFFILVSVNASKIRYDNYKVYSLLVRNEADYNIVRELENFSNEYEFWNSIHLGRFTDIMVPPNSEQEFKNLLSKYNLVSKVKIENVQRLIDNEQPKARSTEFDWTDFKTYEDTYAWLDEKAEEHSDVLSVIEIGRSYEGRAIRAVKLSHKEGNPIIFIESTIHSREWVTTATATWFLNQLLTSSDPLVQDLAQNIDWYIVPILNVDGYVYTHEKNRMWRKTRQPYGLFCVGADGNRNFDFHWSSGSSNNPCLFNFPGSHAFSEVEAAVLSQFYESIPNAVDIYLSFHSYGQYILIPYGHTAERADRYDDMMTIGLKAAEAIENRNGRDYIVGSIYDVMYEAPGSSADYFYGVKNVSLAYGFEFRDHRDGNYGFLLPADEIIPNSEEILDGVIAMVAESRRLGYL